MIIGLLPPSLRVADPVQAAIWYRTVFGLPLTNQSPSEDGNLSLRSAPGSGDQERPERVRVELPAPLPAIPGQCIVLASATAVERSGGLRPIEVTMLGVLVLDADATLAAAIGNGGRPLESTRNVTDGDFAGGRLARFGDPGRKRGRGG